MRSYFELAVDFAVFEKREKRGPPENGRAVGEERNAPADIILALAAYCYPCRQTIARGTTASPCCARFLATVLI
jgi:hypothetical protein